MDILICATGVHLILSAFILHCLEPVGNYCCYASSKNISTDGKGKVMLKIKVACFLGHGVYKTNELANCSK